MIWIIIFIIAVIIIIWTAIENSSAKKKYFSDLDIASEYLQNTRQTFEQASKPIFELIIKQYGENLASKVSNKLITTNMPSELVVLSWGKPGDIKTDYYRGDKTEYWYYDSFVNRLGNIKYKTEVIIENNKIAGWKDIN